MKKLLTALATTADVALCIGAAILATHAVCAFFTGGMSLIPAAIDIAVACFISSPRA